MKTIVIYYGYGNHTKMIVDRIKKQLKCDVLRVEPVVPYSNDYQKLVKETEDNEQTKKIPEIKEIGINLDDYQKVILGTPVWWYTITPPIRTFLTKYTLSKKTIYPFATNAGWLGRTFEEIQSLCKGNIKETMDIKFTTNHLENKLITSLKDIDEWIRRIKLD